MERLYTEREWRAIARVECMQGYMYPMVHEWRILGPAFSGGEFYLAVRPDFLHRKLFGPPRPQYWVYEKPSGLIVAWERSGKALSLAAARSVLTDISPEVLQHLKAWHAEKRAAKETREAILRAQSLKQRSPKPKTIGRRRREIFAAANGRCHYCQAALVLTGDWHVDHKMPKALGGSSDPINLVASCGPCNRAKKDKTDLEFKALLDAKVA